MKKVSVLALAAVVLLSGCGLLPAEEELRKAPIVKSVEEEYFSTTVVKTGNIRDYVSENCTYQYQLTQSLSFGVGGESVKATYVTVGQAVHAGDLLAELSTDLVEEELTKSREECAKLEEEATYYEALMNIEKDREALAKRFGKKYDEDRLKKAVNTYEEVAGRKYVADLRLGELEADLNGRQLIAGIDGVVDYVKEIPVWLNGRINAFDKYISIHSDRTGFVLSTNNADMYDFGDTYTIQVEKAGSYLCEVVKITRPVNGQGGLTYVVLEPLKPDDALEIGVNGSLIIETAYRENVTYIPTSALRTIDEKPAVYVMDENGMRSIRYVEIGLSVTGKKDNDENRTEILSGLKAGETVILK
ncbi:MAG: hypothetical protein IJM57_05875 [Lachnospiraceae bacterium]|nr:hypothetical protein [Lachnospiraceae bacterium]